MDINGIIVSFNMFLFLHTLKHSDQGFPSPCQAAISTNFRDILHMSNACEYCKETSGFQLPESLYVLQNLNFNSRDWSIWASNMTKSKQIQVEICDISIIVIIINNCHS